MTAAQPPTETSPTLHLARWTVTSSSNAQSRGAVDALFKAVDAALTDVLEGHPKLVGYDVHALAEGPEAEGLVIVAIEPPAGLEGGRSAGLYQGRARSTNIIAASIEGYIEALNAMLAEAHWAGAAEAAGRGRRSAPETHGRRAELDDDAADHGAPWFDR